jgi:RHS repeat-associated protein
MSALIIRDDISNYQPIKAILFFVSIFFTLLLPLTSVAQTTSGGIQPFATLTGGPIDVIDMATSHIQISIPIRNKAGKIPFAYTLLFNPNFFKNGTTWSLGNRLLGAPLILGRPFSANVGATARASLVSNFGSCNGHSTDNVYNGWIITDGTGAVHHVPGSTDQFGCVGTSFTAATADRTGYTLVVTGSTQYTIYDRSGNAVVGGTGGSTSTDPDGNSISFAVPSSGTSTYTDSLQQIALTAQEPFTGGGPFTYTFTDASGTNHSFTVNFTTFQGRTNFVCGGMADSSGTISVPTTITTPDGGTYTFGYEQTPGFAGFITGRVASITLPTGGSISYAYSGGNNGINCNSTVTPTLTRTVSDNNGHTSQWKYVNTNAVAVPGNFTVTQTDPVGDVTTFSFSGEAQTQKVVSDVNLGILETIVTCYNQIYSSKAACVTPSTVPGLAPSQTDIYTYLGSALPTLAETKYDTYGNVTEVKHYGVGATFPPSGTPVVDTTYVYGSWNGTSCAAISGFIRNRPCSITAVSSGSTLSQARFTYNSAGHATQMSRLVSGQTFLTSSASYNANGTIATSTDTNGAITNYLYNGPGGCNNLLLTSTVLPVNSLTTSQTWDCNGGVLTSTTDPNGQVTHYGYADQNGVADPLWRLRSVTDPLGNVTNNTYSPNTRPPTTETAMVFNSGASTSDMLTTFDGIGHPILRQTKQSPQATNYDTVSIGYDFLGRQANYNIPCVSAASVGCASASTTTTYDALNRPLQITDGAAGFTQYTYAAGGKPYDLLVTVGPAPTGENQKQRQLEYDGLHRLTSVCEITSASGSGACAQANAKTGYWTKYTFDGLNRVTTVTQNAQGSPMQTRSFVYDGLSRVTSETNPESATKTYVYDTENSCGPNGVYTSNGDLLQTNDTNGTQICNYYDNLHRLVGVGNNKQSSTNVCHRFAYDGQSNNGSIPAGVTITNANGHLTNASTDDCTGSAPRTPITDEFLSYSLRGELTDLYESTPHSGGYYHVANTYWANGALETLSGVSLPTLTYTPDGEGRVSTIHASAGTNPVTAVNYNAASQVTGVTYGSSDAVGFTYDGNTGQMKEYKLVINGTATFGDLNWNANGSLQQLNIMDPFNPPDNQTCTYGADDLSRIASVNCINGTTNVWNQNFSYDAFGNITKSSSGPGSAWMPGYDAMTNHYLAGSGSTYDADGNLTKDPAHSYTWDVYGNLATLDSTTLIYDALDREVEKQSGATFTEFAFGSTGKLAIMNGQTQTKAFVALPGGTQVKYAGSAISTYRLPDWLGSLRAGSNPNRTYSWGIAFAPFGEQYAISGSPALSFTGEDGTADTVSDEYDFLARKQNPVQGRWISPDPAGVEAVNPTNPQSWNRYAYVQNSPLTFTDRSGLILDPQTPSCTESASCDGGYSEDPLSCNPSDIFCAPDPARGFFPIPNGPPQRSIPALNIFTGENSVNIQIGSGNPVTDIWQDALGLPTIPCGAQFGPWCDPGMLPNPWIQDCCHLGNIHDDGGCLPWYCDTEDISRDCGTKAMVAGTGLTDIDTYITDPLRDRILETLGSVGKLLGKWISGYQIAKGSIDAGETYNDCMNSELRGTDYPYGHHP